MSADAKSTDCVQVAVRVRPFIPSEINRGCQEVVKKSHGLPQVYITGETTSKLQEFYAFNNVFMPHKTQEEVYEFSVKSMIPKLFDGYNVTILAYG
jgi:kinesin family member 4